MKMIAINKHSSKLKKWSVEMPNAPFSNRYLQANEHKPIRKKMKTSSKILLILIFSAYPILGLISQNTDWIIYTNSEKVNCQLIQGNYNWIGTNGGIAKINIHTREIDFINSGNSGLQHNFVQCLTTDLDENIWVGSKGTNYCGVLSSFKGNDWTYYDPPVNYKNYNSITVADNGDIWAGTNLFGLLHYDGSVWETFNVDNSPLPSNSIGQILAESDSAIWVIVQGQQSTQSCLAKYNGNNWILIDTSNSNIPSNYVFSMDIDGFGNKWIGTYKGLTMFDGSNWIDYNTENSGIPSNIITSVVCDKENNIWVGTSNSGIACFDGNLWTVYNDINSMLPTNKIKSLDIDDNNTVWIIYNLQYDFQGSRIISFDGTEWVQFETKSSPMPNNFPTSLAIDVDSSVWVGTNDGFANIKDNVWTSYTSQNTPLENDDIRAIACEKNGTKWFGSLFCGLIKYFNQEWTVYTLDNSPLTSRQINCITIDENNNKWIGTSSGGMDSGGLIKISNENNWTIYNSNNSDLPYNTVNCVTIDEIGIIWVGTQHGLVKIENDVWTVFDTTNSDLPDSWICSLAVDSTNTLWIGTRYEGLVKYDSQNWNVYNQENSGIPDNCVFAITVDTDNSLWLGTMYGGLTKFDGTEWTSFNCTNSGMPGSYTTNIIIDHNNTKWITATSLNTGGVALYNENGLTSTNEIEKLEELNMISLFPNPVNNYLNVNINTEYLQFKITLTDITGRVIRIISTKSNQKIIDVSGLPSGLYMISASYKKKIIGINKFIKL